MEKIYMLDNSQGVIRTLVGLKSRITRTKPVLSMLALLMVCLFGVSESAWGIGQAKIKLYSCPSTGGYVYANTEDKNKIGTLTEDDATTGTLTSSTTTMYRYAKAKDGYEFRGWATTNNGSPSSTSTSVTVNVGTWWGTTTTEFWAIFSALPTYYFKATATTNNSTYGNAYVTFTSSAANSTTDTEVTTNCYGTHYNTASMTKTAYFRAVPKTGYVFKGWSTTTSEDDIFNTDKSITYNLTSTKTNIASPATIQYYAIFGERFAPQITGTATENKEVGDSYTANFSFVNTSLTTPSSSNTADFYYTITHELSTSVNNGPNVISYNPSTGAIQALNAGKATITFKNKPTATHQEAEVSFVINVTKKEPTFSCGTSMNVGQNLSCTYTNTSANIPTANSSDNFYYVFTNNTPSGITTGSDTPDAILTFSGNKVYGKNAGTGTITFYQKETYMYKQKNSGAINITVSKLQNTLSCSWNNWFKDFYVNGEAAITISSNNDDLVNSPIKVDVKERGDVAAFRPKSVTGGAKDSVAVFCNLDTARWYVSQAENYKYLAADTVVLSARVKKATQPSCDIADGQHTTGTNVGEFSDDAPALSWSTRGIADSLYFYAKEQSAAMLSTVTPRQRIDGSWSDLTIVTNLNSSFPSTPTGRKLDSTATAVSFTETGSLRRYVKDVRITRHKYFSLQDSKGKSLSTLDLTGNTLKNTKQGSFVIHYSTCADYIYVHSSYDHITINGKTDTTIVLGDKHDGNITINVDYASPNPEDTTATLTAYTQYDNQVITVHAQTEKQTPTLEWKDLYKSNPAVLPMDYEEDAAATASNGAIVTYSVQAGEEAFIEIAADGRSFTTKAVGTVHLTATSEETNDCISVSDTKVVQVTNKQSQTIVWGQTFTRSMKVGNEIPLNAKVKVLNKATGLLEENADRTALIGYECQEGDTVVQFFNKQGSDVTWVRIIGTGTTTLTASVGGDEDYEAASSVVRDVIVRSASSGKCDAPAIYEQDEEILFFKMDLGKPALSHDIPIDRSLGYPDTLTFIVRGESYNVLGSHFEKDIDVYESTDYGDSWTFKTTVDAQAGKTVKSGSIALSKDATNIRFTRPKGGEGYHYIESALITMRTALESEYENNTVNLGQISLDAPLNTYVNFDYYNVHGNLGVAKSPASDNVLSVDEEIELDCGAYDTYALPITVTPNTVGPWSCDITITDKLVKENPKSLTITIEAEFTRGSQQINWTPSQTTFYTIQAEELNAQLPKLTNRNQETKLTSENTDIVSFSGTTASIHKNGTVTLCASHPGTIDYAEADTVKHDFTINITPTAVNELPSISGTIYGGTAANDVVLTGGSAKNTVNDEAVGGSFKVISPATLDAGTYDLTIEFTPEDKNMYSGFTTTLENVTVSQITPEASQLGVTVGEITCGQRIDQASLTNTGSMAGTWHWVDEEANHATPVANTYDDLNVYFEPSNSNYATVYSTVSVKVNKIETLEVSVNLEAFCQGGSETYRGVEYTEAGTYNVPAEGATRDTVYVVTVTVLQPTFGTDAKTITLGTQESWNGIALQDSTVGVHYVVYETTNVAGCDSTVTLTLTVTAPIINEFTNNNGHGDGDWSKGENWSSGSVPTEEAPNVIVSGALEIDENVTVGNLTIENTGSIAVITGGTLTVKGTSEDRTEYGDIHVLNDGAIHLGNSADLQVRDFTLDAKLAGKNNENVKEAAASGQVDSVSNLHVNGDAYFQMTFDPKGKISFGWYDFVVPFSVNISDGIFREGDLENHLVSGVDFLVQEYNETKNANKQKAWSNFYGTMQPGRVYTITFNYDPAFDQNVFVFKKASGTTIGGPTEFATQYTAGSGDTDDFGWNGLGNGTLQHGYITGTFAKMQVYNHGDNKYDVLTGKNPTFAVGTSFFVQVGEAHPTMEWNKTEDYDVNPLYAPKRENVEVEEFLLSLREEDQVDACDHLYVSASEEATEAYVIGHDLRKMGNPTEAKAAQMWATKNGKKLCDIELPMSNSTATCELNLCAPNVGQYLLSVEEAPENTMLYLTYNGRAIWNLTYSPYALDLAKGTTEGYGLKMYVQQVTTDIENGELLNGENGVRKVLIDDVIYIITPEGKMYDITGKSVNY